MAIFVVLSLTALAALSFVSAQADYRLAEKAASSQQQYYEADMAAEQRISEIMQTATGNAQWEGALSRQGIEIQRGEEAAEVSFAQQIDETRSISAVLKLQLDQGGIPTGEWERTKWQTTVEEPESEDTVNLLK